MTRKYNVSASFELGTTIEFDGDVEYSLDFSEAEDVDVYVSGGSEIEASGEATFTVEAESESDAEYKAEEIISDGGEVEDSSGITWTIYNVSVSVERVEIEWTFALVVEVLTKVFEQDAEIGEDERDAFAWLVQHVTVLDARIAEITTKLAEAQNKLAAHEASIVTGLTAQTSYGPGA